MGSLLPFLLGGGFFEWRGIFNLENFLINTNCLNVAEIHVAFTIKLYCWKSLTKYLEFIYKLPAVQPHCH